MQPYPHSYTVSVKGEVHGAVTIECPSLPCIESGAPPQFGGEEGLWSPETLLTAALADCFLLTFRAVARAAHLDWLALECRVEGILERSEGHSSFTRFTTTARLKVPAGVHAERAHGLLEKAERECLVANSLRGVRTLNAEVLVGESAPQAAAAA